MELTTNQEPSYELIMRSELAAALDGLMAHRTKLLTDLRMVMSSPYDVSSARAEIEDDIAVIQAKLAAL